ncbi:hypothetical protein FBU59_000613 [Linderina macrospora]|uniref:Uncharacterized protein n=1 Tax=Linderina macrospora TaxID=4868 RepID=A0ACC1JGC7_9FUNG|nr:hypothetical protein FBU59_000613 [Linderina macrospora]
MSGTAPLFRIALARPHPDSDDLHVPGYGVAPIVRTASSISVPSICSGMSGSESSLHNESTSFDELLYDDSFLCNEKHRLAIEVATNWTVSERFTRNGLSPWSDTGSYVVSQTELQFDPAMGFERPVTVDRVFGYNSDFFGLMDNGKQLARKHAEQHARETRRIGMEHGAMPDCVYVMHDKQKAAFRVISNNYPAHLTPPCRSFYYGAVPMRDSHLVFNSKQDAYSD